MDSSGEWERAGIRLTAFDAAVVCRCAMQASLKHLTLAKCRIPPEEMPQVCAPTGVSCAFRVLYRCLLG